MAPVTQLTAAFCVGALFGVCALMLVAIVLGSEEREMVLAIYTVFVWLSGCILGTLVIGDPIAALGVPAGIVGGHALRWLWHNDMVFEPRCYAPKRQRRRWQRPGIANEWRPVVDTEGRELEPLLRLDGPR